VSLFSWPFPHGSVVVTLYQSAECHECGMVRRLLRGNAIPFTAVTIPADDKTIVRAKFGTESVPVLVHDDFVSDDLRAICDHIEALPRLRARSIRVG
jgi:glutaredoxin